MPEVAFRKFPSIIFALVMWLPIASVAAESGAPTDKYIFQLMDMDGNQVIDRTEFITQKMMVFYVRDINRDLKLSASELPVFATDVFKSADADGDGSVSAFEFNQAEVGMFENLDENADALITFNEFIEFRKKTR
jgi:Ca2+-binding EF-hand superfamily protein